MCVLGVGEGRSVGIELRDEKPMVVKPLQQVLEWHHFVQHRFIITLIRCCRSLTLVYIN